MSIQLQELVMSLSEIARAGSGNSSTDPLLTAESEIKIPYQTKKFCFTVNNWTSEQYSMLLAYCIKYCHKYIIGKEIGESGTPHLQGAIWLRTRDRFSGILNKVGFHFHIEKMEGSWPQSMRYCKKDGDYVFKDDSYIEPYDGFDLPNHSQLYRWQHQIVEQLKLPPVERQVNWYWSHLGGVGKSKFIKYLHFHNPNILVCNQAGHKDVMFYVSENLKDPNGKPTIIFDLHRDAQNKISYKTIEVLLNGLIFSGKYKSNALIFKNPHLFIFANSPPDDDCTRMSTDRWNIVCLDSTVQNDDDI